MCEYIDVGVGRIDKSDKDAKADYPPPHGGDRSLVSPMGQASLTFPDKKEQTTFTTFYAEKYTERRIEIRKKGKKSCGYFRL